METDGTTPMWGVITGFMVIFMVADAALNSSIEYDTYSEDENQRNNALVLVFGLHIVIQVSTFLVLFLLMGETYLFRVGLLNVLARQFPLALSLHPIYLLFTVLLGSVRTNEMIEDHNVPELWQNASYATFSILHKLLAVFYYVANLRAAVKLGDPKFYSREEAWKLASARD